MIDQKTIDLMHEYISSYQANFTKLLNKNNFDLPNVDLDKIQKLYIQKLSEKFNAPEDIIGFQLDLVQDYGKIWENVLTRFLGEEKEPLFRADVKDRRFKDESWNDNPYFDFVKQSYVFTQNWINDLVEKKDDDKQSQLLSFYTRQYLDAMSPSNFAITNPQVIKEALSSNGQSFLKGTENFLNDLENSNKTLQIKTTDNEYFKLGENIASSDGNVIFKNELFELIYYTPTTDEIYQIPLLIVPAWINKFYIFDLSEKNSFVRWALDKGHSVFVISWVNPDESYADVKFEDYLIKGLLTAIDEVNAFSKTKSVNVLGYCLGGTLLTCALSYLEETKKSQKVNSATCLTTLIDFEDAGELSLFIDDEKLKQIDEVMAESGYFDGSNMSAMFSALRANDMIWNFVVNNYLLGKDPFAFDILYWNADTTRIPASTYRFYLKNMYINNLLKKPKGLKLGNVAIDVSKVKTPCYLLATIEDHIAPWQSCFKTFKLLENSCFVLGESGHVSGVINPPTKQKYGYYLSPSNSSSSKLWLENASKNLGSWWDNWALWVNKHSGEKIPASKRKAKKNQCLIKAPGEYALK